MKSIIITLCLLFNICNLYGQKIYGVCIDEDSGDSVGYVTIGIEGVNFGTMANAQGRFELSNIPDIYNERTLVFSHISYEPYKINIAELKKLYTDAKNNGETLKIIMSENTLIIPQIEITKKELEEGYLNRNGPIIAKTYVYHIKPWPYQDIEPTGLDAGINSGILIETKENTWIKQIEFEVLRNTFLPTMIFQLSIYKIEKNGKYIPLMSEPYFIKINYSKKNRKYKCDISDLYIYSDDLIYVALEMVEDSEKGEICLPLYSGKSFYRNMSTGIVVQQDKNIGMRVKGSFPKRKDR